MGFGKRLGYVSDVLHACYGFISTLLLLRGFILLGFMLAYGYFMHQLIDLLLFNEDPRETFFDILEFTGGSLLALITQSIVLGIAYHSAYSYMI